MKLIAVGVRPGDVITTSPAAQTIVLTGLPDRVYNLYVSYGQEKVKMNLTETRKVLGSWKRIVSVRRARPVYGQARSDAGFIVGVRAWDTPELEYRDYLKRILDNERERVCAEIEFEQVGLTKEEQRWAENFFGWKRMGR